MWGKGLTWRTIEKYLEETRNVKMIEMNPSTSLYPFMLAAAGKKIELDTVYYLLRRSPVVVEGDSNREQ
jgi:hypothetical protein